MKKDMMLFVVLHRGGIEPPPLATTGMEGKHDNHFTNGVR